MKNTRFILFIAVILFTGIDSFAQVDLRRVRDKGSEKVKNVRNRDNDKKEDTKEENLMEIGAPGKYGTYAVDDCKNLRKRIEARINTMDELISEGNFSVFTNRIFQARSYNETFRNDCSQDAAKYADNLDREIDRIEQVYKNYQSEQSMAADSREEIQAMIDDIYWGARDINVFLDDLSWTVKGLGTHLERNRINSEKISQIEELVSNNPDYQNESHEYGRKCRDIKNFRKNMEENFNTYVVRGVNAQIEEAYKQKERGKSSFNNALETAEVAVTGAKFLLNIFPDNSEFQQLEKDALAVRTAIYKKYGDDIFTSDFHIENAGGVVFSTKPLSIKQEDKAIIKEEFNANDNIYATVYMKGTLAGLSSNNDEVYIEIYVNDDKRLDRRWNATAQQMNESFYAIELIPDPASSRTQGAIEYTKMFSELSPRRQKIRIEFHSRRTQDPLAKGEFFLDLSSGREEIQKKAKALQDKQLSSVRMPASKMRNANLETQMKNALSEWPGQVQRVVITDSDWQIHRNSITGVIEYRSIGTTVAIKNDDGTCKKVWVSFRQDYANGSYGRTVQHGVGGTDAIACENVNK